MKLAGVVTAMISEYPFKQFWSAPQHKCDFKKSAEWYATRRHLTKMFFVSDG